MTEAIGSSFIPKRAKYYYNEMVYAAALSDIEDVESTLTLARCNVIRYKAYDEVWYHSG